MDFEPETFTVSINFLRHVCQKCILRVRRNFRGNTQVLKKHVIIIVFRRLWVKFLVISIKIGMILKNLSYVSRDNLWGKIVLLFFFSLVYSDFERNSILPVQRNVFGENFCIKKLFFCKYLSDFERKFFGLLAKLIPAICHHSILLLLRKVSEKIFSKKIFFIVSRLGAKNQLSKKHQDEYENFVLRVRWIIFRRNILFKWFDIFFLVFRAKNCNFWKKFMQTCENSFLHV